MKDIKELREKINQIDQEMASLYENRMRVVSEIANFKMANNLAVFDKSREQEVLKRNLNNISSDELLPLYSRFIQEVMGESKSYQRYLMNATIGDN